MIYKDFVIIPALIERADLLIIATPISDEAVKEIEEQNDVRDVTEVDNYKVNTGDKLLLVAHEGFPVFNKSWLLEFKPGGAIHA